MRGRREKHPSRMPLPEGAPAPISVYVHLVPGMREAPVFLCNGTSDTLEGECRNRHNQDDKQIDWQDLEEKPGQFLAGPGSCCLLFHFTQGDWCGETEHYDFVFGGSRDGKSAVLKVTGDRFKLNGEC